MVANIAVVLNVRPCELVEYEGSVYERLLFDSLVLSKADIGTVPTSVEGKIRARRRALGIGSLYT